MNFPHFSLLIRAPLRKAALYVLRKANPCIVLQTATNPASR